MTWTDFSHLVGQRRLDEAKACHCVGPQNGQPLCPCRMLSVKVLNGRYVEIIDHGPAPVDQQLLPTWPMYRGEQPQCAGCKGACGNVACPLLPKIT